MKQFKIRASAAGQIMTNGRAKGEAGKTCYTYLDTWVKEQVYGRRYEFSSKYTDKGNIMEDNSLDFIASMLGHELMIKNTRFIEDADFTGTPDVILKDEIIDVKNSWSWQTFPLFETELPNNDYFFQMQVYMALTDKPAAKVIYVLSDTPQHLITKEARYKAADTGRDFDEVLQEVTRNLTYPDIPDRYKIKVFDVPRDEAAITAIRDRVALCRKYIETLTKNL